MRNPNFLRPTDNPYGHFYEEKGPIDVLPGPAFTPWLIKTLPADALNQLSSYEQLVYFCAYGSLAPTTHNTSPEKFSIDPGSRSVEVVLDRSLVLPASDKDGRQALVSCGCVTENITQAAQAYGLEQNIEFYPISEEQTLPIQSDLSEKYTPLLKISFAGEIQSDSNTSRLAAIKRRKVNRAEYDQSVLPPETEAEIYELTREFEDSGIAIHLVTNRWKINAFAQFQAMADNFVIKWEKFKSELGQWFILNRDQTAARGMRGHEFGFGDVRTQELQSGFRGETRITPDTENDFIRGGKIGLGTSSAVASITIQPDTVMGRIQAGILYERIALYVTSLEYTTSMHAGITEIPLPRNAFKATILGLSPLSTITPTVVFRLGKPLLADDLNRPHSSRPAIETLLI